jgi:hypothetical protein
MTRITDSGHRVSGAADSDLAYIAERAEHGADRARRQLETAIAHARDLAATGVAPVAFRLAWHSVVAQAGRLVYRAEYAARRRREAGLDGPEDGGDRMIWERLGVRQFALGDFAPHVDGQTAATLLASLLGTEDARQIGAYLYVIGTGMTVHYSADDTPDGPTPHAWEAPPPIDVVYYVVMRVR